MPRDVARLRGPYHPYRKARVDWSTLFEQLSAPPPTPTVKDIAEQWSLPYETVRRRWKKYQQGVKEEDPNLLAFARGDADGRRDNHRIFTREEEAELRTELDKENTHPNQPTIQRKALDIHRSHQSTHPPSANTRSHPHADLPFHASPGFVERIKRDLRYSPQKPDIRRRCVRTKGVEWETERLSMAIQFIDRVHRSVLRNGSDWVINADEISCKVINPPRTLLAHVGGEHPPVL